MAETWRPNLPGAPQYINSVLMAFYMYSSVIDTLGISFDADVLSLGYQ